MRRSSSTGFHSRPATIRGTTGTSSVRPRVQLAARRLRAPTSPYLAGNDVFYSYTPTSDCLTSVIMQATAANSSVFVYNGCTSVGVACVAGQANTGTGARNFTFNAIAGTQYIIVVSSSAATPTLGYTLTMQCIGCQAATAITGTATPASITTSSADLTWTNGGGAYTDYQVAVQTTQTLPTAGSAITNVTGLTTTVTGLSAATTYYFYVRAVCPGGDPATGPFTQWYGPFAFTTKICDDADKCTYTFRLTDSANNGWNGARMEVRQNGILVANTAGNTTIGQQYTSGAGPVDVTYQLCKNVPFTLEWTVAGTQPQQCIVTVINSFSQAIFVKPAGTGGAGQTVYTGLVDCDNPRCDAPVMNVTATNVTTNGATINWTNNPVPLPAGWSWDIYIYPTVGGTPPTAGTIPTYDDVTTFPFPTNIPLTPDTAYSVCVRVNCSPNPSEWSCGSFTTLPTCPKPTSPVVSGITLDSATLDWTPGTPTDNSWEVLLIPGCATPPPPPAVNPDLTGGALLFQTAAHPLVLPAGTLTPATIYYYYVRTLCPGNDKSTWTGPVMFNTLLCDNANKCNYKFLLTDTGSNGWNGAKIQVRQNCIVVATLGTQISGAGPTTVTVALCDDVPFDLYWSVAGTAPNEIGVTVQNPFVDNIYTYAPGTGTPLTVLYSGVAECTPPTCPKPVSLTTVSTGQTTANVSWVETGTATQWEVYAVPTGGVLPVNGSPVTGVAPYYIANTNTSFQITGLTPGSAKKIAGRVTNHTKTSRKVISQI
ncbi:MAG: hypothetical protein EOP49_11575 [Sphingobacteriales bacterium]|nr:MAG: hypothetical protein EOP49_11575 [Sphingobacteriales bacterium]